MARTALAVQNMVRAGLTPAFTAFPVDGHSVVNDGKMFLYIKNTDAVLSTVTIQTPGTVDTLAVAERIVTIPATTGVKMIGPFPPASYNQTGATVYVDATPVTALTIAAIKVA